MSRFLFLPMPGHGHVNPTLAVAAELVARGHDVSYLLTEEFRAGVEASGARFLPLSVSLRPGPAPAAARTSGNPIEMLLNRLATVAEEAREPLEAIVAQQRPDVLVVESMSLWGRLLAAATGIPTAGYSPSYVMAPGTPFAERMRAAAAGAGVPAVDVDRMRAIATSYGADPAAAAGGPFARAAADVAVFMPRAFHPDGDEVGAGFHFVGPMTGRVEQATGFELGAMGSAPGVYVSLGTVFNDDSAFFRSCLTAIGERPAVIAAGRAVDPAALDAPPNVVLAAHVPQLRVLRHTSVFVTHGGMNSTMEAAAAGVPMVVVPQMVEQAMTARRVAELGLGVHLDPADVTAESLAEAIATVERDPAYREAAQQMAKECAAAGGVTEAANVMEAAGH